MKSKRMQMIEKAGLKSSFPGEEPRIKWHHIMEKQPENDEMIVQCDPPHEGYHTIGMRKYHLDMPFEEFITCCNEYDWPLPDFWWVYLRDFPFPGIKE